MVHRCFWLAYFEIDRLNVSGNSLVNHSVYSVISRE